MYRRFVLYLFNLHTNVYCKKLKLIILTVYKLHF
jgi:hypothetical protein